METFQSDARKIPPDERRFYKYVTSDTAGIVLRNRTLRWSRPVTFNDPFDTQFNLQFCTLYPELRKRVLDNMFDIFRGEAHPPARFAAILGDLDFDAIRNAIRSGVVRPPLREEFDAFVGSGFDEGLANGERILPEILQQIGAQMSETKIICVSECGVSLPMWAYYAEQHKGVVLGFKHDGRDSIWPMANPVEYREIMPPLYEDDEIASLFLTGDGHDPRTVIHRMIHTKASDWRHEREWRLHSGKGRFPDQEHEDIPFGHTELETVLIGCRMGEPERAVFLELALANFPHAKVYQMSKLDNQFALTATLVS